MHLIRSIPAILVALPVAAAAAGDPPSPRAGDPDTGLVGVPIPPVEVVDLTPLQNLEGVCVFVHEIDDEAELNGLYEKQVYFNVALDLVRAGIDVIPPDHFEESVNASRLDVFVRTVSPDGLSYIYSLGLSLTQPVSLVRDDDLTFSASTWRSEELGIVAIGESWKLLDSIDERVALFVDDYHTANP